MKNQTSLKSAFTLIELLIVIAIVGVLTAALLGMMRGSGDAARATQCMTNMRALAMGIHTYTMQSGDGFYPPAGSFKHTSYGTGGAYYNTSVGWISSEKSSGNRDKNNPKPILFDEADEEKLRFALTNGCVWASCNKSEKIYQCPAHAAACLKANQRNPGWSYVMNATFYWSSQSTAFPSWHRQGHGGISVKQSDTENPAPGGNRVSRPPEKVLLLAEIQGLDDARRGLRAVTGGGEQACDGVLQYTDEMIGFNHVLGKSQLAGHVAFADGHIEKFVYPETGDAQQLTRWLCVGREVSFNGSTYEDLQGNQ